jgi:hypothetical protein
MSGTEDKILFSRREERWFYLQNGTFNIEDEKWNI